MLLGPQGVTHPGAHAGKAVEREAGRQKVFARAVRVASGSSASGESTSRRRGPARRGSRSEVIFPDSPRGRNAYGTFDEVTVRALKGDELCSRPASADRYGGSVPACNRTYRGELQAPEQKITRTFFAFASKGGRRAANGWAASIAGRAEGSATLRAAPLAVREQMCQRDAPTVRWPSARGTRGDRAADGQRARSMCEVLFRCRETAVFHYGRNRNSFALNRARQFGETEWPTRCSDADAFSTSSGSGRAPTRSAAHSGDRARCQPRGGNARPSGGPAGR